MDGITQPNNIHLLFWEIKQDILGYTCNAHFLSNASVHKMNLARTVIKTR